MSSNGARRLGVISGHFEAAGGSGPRHGAGGGAAAGGATALGRVLDGDTPARAELRARMKEHMRLDRDLYTP
jgi:hypothetical protein